MGLIKRFSQRSQDSFWQAAGLVPGERRINYAHLAIAFEKKDKVGTAFLTDQRFIWRLPSSDVGFECTLGSCAGWAVRSDRPGQPGLAIGFWFDPGAAESQTLLLYPAQPHSPANRALAQQFFQDLMVETHRCHPEWND